MQLISQINQIKSVHFRAFKKEVHTELSFVYKGNFKIKLITMEIFIGIKKLLRILGFLKFKHPNSKIEKAINILENIVYFCCAPFFFLSPLSFLFFRAETFYEKTFAFCITIVLFFLTIAYNILIWKRKQILELFDEFESKIIKRNMLKKNK